MNDTEQKEALSAIFATIGGDTFGGERWIVAKDKFGTYRELARLENGPALLQSRFSLFDVAEQIETAQKLYLFRCKGRPEGIARTDIYFVRVVGKDEFVDTKRVLCFYENATEREQA